MGYFISEHSVTFYVEMGLWRLFNMKFWMTDSYVLNEFKGF